MHICLLVSHPVFHNPYGGGEEKFTISLAKWLAAHSNEATIIGRTGFISARAKHLSNGFEEKLDENMTTQKKPKMFRHRYLAYALRPILSIVCIFKILSINIKCPISLIHAQDTGYGGLAAILSSKILRIPVIISSHGIRHKTLESNTPTFVKKVLIKFEYNLDIFTVKHADKVIAVSQYVKTYFEQITNREICNLPIPINLNEFSYSELNRSITRKELGVGEREKVIGFIGRLTEEKNLFTLLHSFANAVEENPFLRLILVGNGPIENRLKKQVSESDIKNSVTFCGVRNDVAKILSGLDIFVLPSYTEGLPTALLEAMACERAIVCSDIPANRELLNHNKEALFADPYNQDEFKQAIQLLCNDEALRTRLGRNAKIRASQYDEEVVFPNIMQSYKDVYNLC